MHDVVFPELSSLRMVIHTLNHVKPVLKGASKLHTLSLSGVISNYEEIPELLKNTPNLQSLTLNLSKFNEALMNFQQLFLYCEKISKLHLSNISISEQSLIDISQYGKHLVSFTLENAISNKQNISVWKNPQCKLKHLNISCDPNMSQKNWKIFYF